jgi:hypothetical protein
MFIHWPRLGATPWTGRTPSINLHGLHFHCVSALPFAAGAITFFAICRKYQYNTARAFTRRGRAYSDRYGSRTARIRRAFEMASGSEIFWTALSEGLVGLELRGA